MPLLLFLLPSRAQNTAPDYSKLTSRNHPRLFITDADLKGIKKQLKTGSNSQLTVMHNGILQSAESRGLSEKKLSYNPAVKAETLLPTIREGMVRIVNDAYAYRYTKDKRFLNHAVMDIETICDHMEEWNTKYFLVRAEMAMTFAIAYDWLYKDLSQDLKKKMLDCLDKEVFEVAKTRGSYNASNNWNHVTNAGLVCSALATYEVWPEKAKALVEKSVKSNPIGLKGTYYPDGASPEGPIYWAYAMSWEGMMLMSLKDNLGTDFDLSKAQGFEKSAYYRIFAENNGKYFNYADCGQKAGSCTGSWFCAYWFKNKDLLASELALLDEKNYHNRRDGFLAIACSYRMGQVEAGKVEGRTYRAGGKVPITILRNGWEPQDSYLGIKGGSPKGPHGHMDGGSFVFDAYGVRWACEYPTKSYEVYRRIIKKAGGTLDMFDMSQPSYRWHLFPYHNRQHNTLTINDCQQEVKGAAKMLPVEDQDALTASLDMTGLYQSSVAKVLRTLSIKDDGSLEVIDEIAGGGKDAVVRWNMVTTTDPAVTDEGVLLTKDGVSAFLKSEGVAVEYKEWPNDPSKYDTPVKDLDYPSKGYHMVGYEFTVPAGKTVKVTTTLKKYAPTPEMARKAYRLGDFNHPVFYDAVKSMEKGDKGEMVAVMIHGWGGGMGLLPEQLSLEESLKGVYVIGPRFPRVPVMRKKGVVDNRPHWNDSYDASTYSYAQCVDDWRGGGDADGFDFSSFDVVDHIFSILADKKLYPNLKRVLLVGYSAGGQFVSRYVAAGKGTVRDGVEVKYVSMASSTYLNLNDDVPWLYGLAERPRYCAGVTKSQILANLAVRKAFYACGELDSVNGSTDKRAPAMLQGPGRIERLHHLEEHMSQYPDWRKMSTFHVIPGIAHNAVKAYKDPEFLRFVFDK